jgi:tRNA (guanine10-N2)-dimethyltransferase
MWLAVLGPDVGLIVELSGEQPALAEGEVQGAVEALGEAARRTIRDGRILLVDTALPPRRLGPRLALAHYVGTPVASGSWEDVTVAAASTDLGGRTFRVTAKVAGGVSWEHAVRRIGAALARTGRVDLRRPAIHFRLVVQGRYHLFRVDYAVDRKAFEGRKVALRPFVKPISLHPRLARALVNMSRVRPGETLLDPFCGTGGIVLEGALVGARPFASDLREDMVDGTRATLRHFGVEARTAVADVGDVPTRVDRVAAVATDPPYGRATTTRGEPLTTVYRRAFRAFADLLPEGRSAAVILPDPRLADKAGPDLRLAERHPLRIHKSLSRHFCRFVRE